MIGPEEESSQILEVLRGRLGAGFVVPFFSDSRSLAIKSSLKSHQMTPFFIQNEDWEQNDVVLVKTLSF